MKHIFIINPAAGKQNSFETVRAELDALEAPIDYEIYCTQGIGDATAYIRNYCNTHTERVRFYACGGDGTLNEVVNGAVGFPHASVACYPCGSGNDFVKYYGGKSVFLDLKELVTAPDEYIDLMCVDGKYAINATHFGFDSCAAKIMTRVRRMRLIGGKNAYTTGVVVGLFKAMKNRCKVWADGELLNPKGYILLCTIANGQYVGGSYRCAPRSVDNDGMLEICLVHPVSIFTFIKVIGEYKSGAHLDNPKLRKFISYCRGKSVTIEAPDGFVYCLDGELVTKNKFTVEVAERALRFAVPRTAKPLPEEKHIPAFSVESEILQV